MAEVVVRGVVVAIAEYGNFVDEAGVADEVVKMSASLDEPVVLGGVAPLKAEE